MDIFTAVVLDHRSIVPDSTRTFSTLAAAKAYAESTTNDKTAKWEEWDEGKFVYGYGTDEIDEPIVVVYGSELE